MNEALRWLLDLSSLGFDQEGVELGLTRPLPAWGWALVVLGAAGLGWLCYRRLEGARGGRAALGVLRALLLILLVVLVAGPRLIKPNETEERDWVLVLADRSASMSVADATGGPARRTRESQLRDAIDRSREVWRQLGAERVVVWLGFDAGAYELDVPGEGATPDLGEPVGRRTDLNRALEAALKRAAARPLSGVVVFSDGRSIAEPSRALVRRLESEKIPVFTVPLGDPRGVADLAVRRVEGPRVAFVKDAVPVEVEVERLGPPGAGSQVAMVELVDRATGLVLDTREVDFGAAPPPPDAPEPGSETGAPAEAARRVTLTTRPGAAGAATWDVRVRPAEGGSSGVGDLVAENNQGELSIELVDRPLRVLYLEGYPRWEYRYLKNLLIREESVASGVMLLAPGRRYIQEGSITLDGLPRSPEEWGRFDVLIMGDVYPGVFTTEQLAQIRDRVATAGLGLIWIGGEGATPGQWRDTLLADLLPFTLSNVTGGNPGAALLPPVGAPVTVRATPAADALGVLRLADQPTGTSWWNQRLSDPATGWSRLHYAQRIDPAWLKPTAEVLAVARPLDAGAAPPQATGLEEGETPLVLSMRFGAGRVLYVGTDEIWRWRYGRGEHLPERFWVQMVRLLGRESVARSGKPAQIEATPRRAEVDRPVRLEVTLLDQSLVDAAPSNLRVRIAREGPLTGGTGDVGLEASEVLLTPDPGETGAARPRRFSATWIPTESGRFSVRAVDPLLLSTGAGGGQALATTVEVWQPEDELRRPQADHELLARLSEATGGRTLRVNEIPQIPDLLPNRRLRLAGEPDVETLWDTPLALILIVTLLTAEWIGRRLLRLA